MSSPPSFADDATLPPSSPPEDTLGAHIRSGNTTPPATTSTPDATNVKRTPTANKPSTHKIQYKSRRYEQKIVNEMKTCYHQLSYDTFITRFATIAGQDTNKYDLPKEQISLAAEKLRAILDGTDESNMYAPLVSFNDSTHETGS
jgi:hypothetical protein